MCRTLSIELCCSATLNPPAQLPAISNAGEINDDETIHPTPELEPSDVESSKKDVILLEKTKPLLPQLKLKQDASSVNKLGAVFKPEENKKITCFWKPQNWTVYKPR